MVTQDELFKQKKRIYLLSKEVKKSYKKLTNLCNEISNAEDLSLIQDNPSGSDGLIFILSERIISHLTYTHSLISAQAEYLKMLEKLTFQSKLIKE